MAPKKQKQKAVVASATFDTKSPNFLRMFSEFVAHAKEASALVGGEAPVCLFQREGPLLHVQVVPASKVRGGVSPVSPGERDAFRRRAIPLVELESSAPPSELPEGSKELAADVRALLQKIRG